MSFEVKFFRFVDKIIDKRFNSPPLDEKKKRKIVTVKDCVYDQSDYKTCTYDAYYLPKEKGEYPVMVYIHGGGFVAGDKSMRRGVCKWYATQGLFVISVNYGLCPKYRFPVAVKHIVTALNYLFSKAEELNLRKDKVMVSGDSAGAYYASMLLALQGSEKLQSFLGVKPCVKIGAGVLNCGIYDMETVMNRKMVFSMNKRLFRALTGLKEVALDRYEYRDYCSPSEHINGNFPPCVILHSSRDVFCGGQAQKLIGVLNANGVKFYEYCASSIRDNHCFPLFWKSKSAKRANLMTEKFVNNFISGCV